VIVVALLIFGPRNCLKWAERRKSLSEFRNGTKEMTDSLRRRSQSRRKRGKPPTFAATHSTAYQTPTQLSLSNRLAYSRANRKFLHPVWRRQPSGSALCAACGTKLPTVAGEPTNRSEIKMPTKLAVVETGFFRQMTGCTGEPHRHRCSRCICPQYHGIPGSRQNLVN